MNESLFSRVSKSSIFKILTCVLLSCKLSAQINIPIPKNPEAATLAKSLDYPLNNNYGVPNIGIKLFNISNGALTYEVKASYHAGGFKVGQQPSWIGMNWSINAVPQVTRTINGGDDLHGYILNNMFNAYNADSPKPNNNYLARLDRNEVDEQPDEFNFSLMNKSGSFYFQKYSNQTYKALPVPYDQLDIRFSGTNLTIIDDDGTKYEFGGAGFIEQSGLQGSAVSITAWKCRMIVSPNLKDTVKFNYYPIQQKYRSVFTDILEVYDVGGRPISHDYSALNPDIFSSGSYTDLPPILKLSSGWPHPYTTTHFLFGTQSFNPSTITYNINNPNIFFDYGGYAPEQIAATSILQILTLKQINFKGNKIDFFVNQLGAGGLDSIKVINYLGDIISRIEFKHTYSLDTVKFLSTGNLPEIFKIEYQPGGYGQDENLPSDAWGYPNPQNGFLYENSMEMYSSSNLPFQWINVFAHAESGSSNANNEYFIPIGRTVLDSNEDDMKSGIIKKIIYPTGGFTEFTFEANRYKLPYSNDVKLAGGLRVKSIKNYASSDIVPSTERYFKYSDNGIDDVGHLVINPLLNNFEYTQYGHWHATDQNSGAYSYVNFRKRTFVKTSLDNTTFSNGSPISYQNITVYESENGILTGKTVFSYNSNHSDFRIVNTPLTQHQLIWDNGLLNSQIDYAYVEGNFQWIRKKTYQYESFILPEKIHVGKVFNTHLLTGDLSNIPSSVDPAALYGNFNYITYGLSVGYSRKVEETEQSRGLGDLSIVSNEKKFFYDNPIHPYCTRVIYKNSKNEDVNEYTIYPQDFEGDLMASSLITNHKLRIPIEQVLATKGTKNMVLKGNIYTYDVSPENYYKREFMLETDDKIPISSYKFSNVQSFFWPEEEQIKKSFSPDSRYKPTVFVKSYDEYGNITEIINKDSQVTSYIWAYKGSELAMEIKNLDYESIKNFLGVTQLSAFASSSPTREVLNAFSDSIKSQFPNCFITFYTYKPLIGVTSVTDSRGVCKYYDYDSFGRLKTERDHNGNIIKSYAYHFRP